MGVVAVVAVSENVTDIETNLELARQIPETIRPAAGLFPTILDPTEADAVVALIRANRDRLFAIGEVGLDLWKVQDAAGREVQSEIFRRFIDLSLELDLPLNVHSRAAGRPTIDLLLARGATRVQLHAFDGRAGKALPAVEAGFFFSIPPSVVRSVQKQKLVRRVPLECLLVETDSPVLGPDAETRNEPSNITVAVEAIAEIKQLPVAKVAAVVTENTVRLYGDRILSGSKDS
jgi:TatD DNase family protein